MILIADDDVVYDERLKKILEYEGYTDIRIVHTGAEVGQLIKQSQVPAVLILDMMLPYDATDSRGATLPSQPGEAHGISVLSDLRNLGSDLSRVIAITALPPNEDLSFLGNLGVKHVFRKPVLAQDLLISVASVYRQVRSDKQ